MVLVETRMVIGAVRPGPTADEPVGGRGVVVGGGEVLQTPRLQKRRPGLIGAYQEKLAEENATSERKRREREASLRNFQELNFSCQTHHLEAWRSLYL